MRTAIRLWILVAFAALTSSSALAQPGYTGPDPGGYTQRQGIPYVSHDASCTGKGTALSPLSCGGTGSSSGSFSSLSDTGPFFLTGTIGPAAITGAVNNWNPCDSVSVTVCLANTNGVRVALSGAASLSGLVAQSSGFQIELRNTSSTLALTLLNQSASSTAANRFLLPNSASWVVPPQGSVILRYSTSAGAWAPASSNNNNLVGTALAVSGTSSLADVAATSIADSGALVLTGSIAPTALAGSVNNYAPCDVTTPANCLATTNLVRQDASVASTITGLAAQASGQAVALLNISATNSITLTNEDTNSTAPNRFTLPNGASWVIPPGGAVLLRYSSATSRWRPEHSNNNNVMATALTASGQVLTTGSLTDTFTATQNDYPIGNVSRFIWNGTSSASLNGIAGGADGRLLFVENISNGFTLTLTVESGSSLAANRITGLAATSLALSNSGSNAILIYDGTAARWRVLACNTSTFTPTINFTGGVTASGTNNFSGVVSLTNSQNATLASGTTNDWAPGTQTELRTTPASGGSTVTGLSNGATSGRVTIITNVSATDNITLANDDGASSTATSRFLLDNAASCVLPPLHNITLRYDGTSARWRPIDGCPHSTQAGYPGATITTTDVGTQNDYNPTGLGNATILRLNPGSALTVTGIAGGSDGRQLFVCNQPSAAGTSTLSHEGGGSIAANRILLLGTGSVALNSSSGSTCIMLLYDGVASRWREIARSSTVNNNGVTFTNLVSLTSANNKGTITLSGGTGTATVTAGETCTCTDTTAVAAVRCNVSSTTLTATGTTTDVIAYHCF